MITRVLAGPLAALLLASCTRPEPTLPENPPALPAFESGESPEQILISALEELEFINDWEPSGQGSPDHLPKPGSDTTFVYGEITDEGYGAVVTRRHTYPKGLPLISLRRTHGREEGHLVSEAKTYISPETFAIDDPQSFVRTELYALSADTIVTHLRRNGTIETYTFRLPIITTQVGDSPGLTRVTMRYGLGGRIVVETRDGSGALLRARTSWGESDGSLFVQTTEADGSWRRTRTLGSASGTILRETHTGSGAP